MKLTIQLKLLPTRDQADGLTRTLVAANAACDYISQVAWASRTFGKFALQKLCYQDVRATFGLSAQMTIRALSKVGDAYKLDTKTKRTFRPTSAIAYDDRILSFAIPDSSVSIWTLDQRQSIPFVCGERQHALLPFRRGESDLAFVRGNWYLFATAEVEHPHPIDVDGVLGVDLGLVNLATDSDGEQHSGAQVKQVRERRFRHRQRLQQVTSRRARWRLRQLAGKEARFQKDVNHCISKRLVQKATTDRKALALEDLTGIRERTTVRRSQRRQHASWAFHQLRSFVTYKAQRQGVPVYLVDPRNTSRTCSACGYCDSANRKTQDRFLCVACGFQSNADRNAAVNISRAVVNQPLVSAPHVGVGYKLPA